jgi:uncharacterized membrane protein
MSVLPIHIVAGLTAIISGFIAVFALKGAGLHRRTGTIFVYAMLILAFTGATMAFIKHQTGNVIGASIAFYLVTTGLLTVRPRDKTVRSLDVAALLIGTALGIICFKVAIDGVNSPSGTVGGIPPGMIFFFGTAALLGAAGDMRVLLTGPLHGTHRIARHLWRMCFALFVASGSFFLGQAKVFPKPMRIYPLLAIPALLPLVLLIYWLARVLFTKWYRRRAESFRRSPAGSTA